MRLFLFAFLAAGLIGCASTPRSTVETVGIKDIHPRYIEAEQFKRIGEYLSGKEVTGSRVILRSDPDSRTGAYFILSLDEQVRRLPKGTTIRGEFYTSHSPEAQEFEMKLPSERPRTKEIFFGLTGDDWPVGSSVPGAWRFTILTPNGATMAEKESYLWKR